MFERRQIDSTDSAKEIAMYCRTLRYTHEYQTLHVANFEVTRADGFSQSQAQSRVLHIVNVMAMRLFEERVLTKKGNSVHFLLGHGQTVSAWLLMILINISRGAKYLNQCQICRGGESFFSTTHPVFHS